MYCHTYQKEVVGCLDWKEDDGACWLYVTVVKKM